MCTDNDEYTIFILNDYIFYFEISGVYFVTHNNRIKHLKNFTCRLHINFRDCIYLVIY
jgi:hypothetical protein